VNFDCHTQAILLHFEFEPQSDDMHDKTVEIKDE